MMINGHLIKALRLLYNNVMENREIQAELEVQGVLQPGQEGWWKVWGANVTHIRTGDVVHFKGDEGWVFIEDTFEAKAAPIRRGFVSNGERFTMGVLVPVVVLRRGTHNFLA
jgi:hypothetical protein